MMLWNKSRIFILILVIIAVCDARTTNKKSKLAEKKQHSKNRITIGELLAEGGSCEEMDTSDNDYLYPAIYGSSYDFESPAKCGEIIAASRKGSTKRKSKWSSFLKRISKLQHSVIEDIKRFGKKDSDDRIVHGEPVIDGQWPWLVAIAIPTGPDGEHELCGGSIIASGWVVTAAHCFKKKVMDPCSVIVRAGTINYESDPEGNAADRRVYGIYRHPKYNEETNQHDIALLKLQNILYGEKPVFGINAICLPKTARSAEPGTTCQAAGWGLQEEGTTNFPVSAMQTKLPVIAYNGSKCGDYEPDRILPGMLCAGFTDGSTDTCQGDSGGPLSYLKDGKHYLLGVTSFGEGCAQKGYPGIYTDVGQYPHWIASVIDRFG